MVEVVVKEADSQGRISIPVRWRMGWKSRKLVLIRREDRIELCPIESMPPSELFDSIEVSESVDFVNPHSVKKALPELR
jgi:bifunctional DNA-binding transcriptional regulator/antitoxin component of YhaV-PrlF toxin-antitoxin module